MAFVELQVKVYFVIAEEDREGVVYWSTETKIRTTKMVRL